MFIQPLIPTDPSLLPPPRPSRKVEVLGELDPIRALDRLGPYRLEPSPLDLAARFGQSVDWLDISPEGMALSLGSAQGPVVNSTDQPIESRFGTYQPTADRFRAAVIAYRSNLVPGRLLDGSA